MGAKKLEPIDWHEFANDAVLNGNMSTLYQRPVTEDPSAYASSEALLEIEKRVARPIQSATSPEPIRPTVGSVPTEGMGPTVGMVPAMEASSVGLTPTVGIGPTVGTVPTMGMEDEPASISALDPTVGMRPTVGLARQAHTPASIAPVPILKPTVGRKPTGGVTPTVGMKPTVGTDIRIKVKPIRDVQDALTLAGHVLYKAMYGAPDGAKSKACAKGYRQLAAETHLDKDTVRDLISEFKEKGIVREVRTYDPDTRSAKTYEVLSYKSILQMWREADLQYVTTGRKRPVFCTATGLPMAHTPTVGMEPTVGRMLESSAMGPTVGPKSGAPTVQPLVVPPGHTTDMLSVMQQITGAPVDQEAADRLIADCRTEAADCTLDEIVEIAWSKAFLCRSGKIENPIGFLITQVPKHFQPEALRTYRQNKRKELEAAAAAAGRDEDRRREAEREMAELEEKKQARGAISERHRVGQGIDLKGLLQDPEADDVLKDWARRMIKLGHRYQPQYV